MVLYIVYLVENVIKAAPKHLDSYIILGDMNGFSLRNFNRADFQQIGGYMNDFYPELLYRLIVVNSNFFFKNAWSIAKMMVHPLTVAKIHIQGTSLKEIYSKLAEYLDDDEIPTEFGGKKVVEL
jgi:CRAL/TRIO domain